MISELDYFKLIKDYYAWSYENYATVTPATTALYSFIVHHWNNMGRPPQFGLPTYMAMTALGIKNYRTYKKAIDIIIKHNFIEVVQESKNQYSSNIISLQYADVKNTKALIKASQKHDQEHGKTYVQRSAAINEERGKRREETPVQKIAQPRTYPGDFEKFWKLYPNKKAKKTALRSWSKLTDDQLQELRAKWISFKSGYTAHLQREGKEWSLLATTFLNQERWNDEFTKPTTPVVHMRRPQTGALASSNREIG